jgi:zinc/manganese transport system permease protein
VLGAVCILAIALLFRPLLLSAITPEVAMARGIKPAQMEICFLLVVAAATTMTVPVVGALLLFTLMIGPPAAARTLTPRPGHALALSIALALACIWIALAAAYLTNWPVGFFVGSLSALAYGAARLGTALHRRAISGPSRLTVSPAV